MTFGYNGLTLKNLDYHLVFLMFQILLIMSHPPLVSSLVDVLVNGDEVGTPEDSPLPLRKVSVVLTNILLLNSMCFRTGCLKKKSKIRNWFTNHSCNVFSCRWKYQVIFKLVPSDMNSVHY